MPGRDDCPSCDFRDRPEPCYCLGLVSHGRPRLCQLAEERPEYRETVRRRTLGEAAPPPMPVSAPPAPATIDPFRLALDLCDFRVSCSCTA